MKFINKITNKERGFTLVEIIIVLGIFGFVLVIITTYALFSLRAENKSVKSIMAQNNARTALTKITGEIRSSMYSDSGSYPVSVAEGQNLTIYTNIDGDVNAERVRYFVDGAELKRGVTEPEGQPPNYDGPEEISTLANYLSMGSDNIFTYYDRDYNGTGDPLTFPVNKSEIRLIGINIIIDVDQNRSPEPLRVSTESQLRNLKDNL